MKRALELLNELKDNGLIEDYAVGGGIASIFYTEPVFTYDLDVFVLIKTDPRAKIVSLSSVYEYLKEKGCPWEGEHIVVEGMPVQLIPAGSELEHCSVRDAKEISYGGVKTRIPLPEYLIAIALKTGRAKDYEKVGRLLKQAKIDEDKLEKILKEHGLWEGFLKWKERSK